MSDKKVMYDLAKDDLSAFAGGSPAFVTFGETMVRDTPSEMQRLEMARQVHLSLAGSELTLAVMLSRFGIPSAYVTRVPDNPYGWLLRDTARSQGVNTEYIVWANKAEPIGRFLYELGRTPRKSVGYYQRMYSAASRLGAGMVNWRTLGTEASALAVVVVMALALDLGRITVAVWRDLHPTRRPVSPLAATCPQCGRPLAKG